jgi:hypothetical protein
MGRACNDVVAGVLHICKTDVLMERLRGGHDVGQRRLVRAGALATTHLEPFQSLA